MRQLVLKKKESRLLWQILIRGLIVSDRLDAKASKKDKDLYRELRLKVISAWRGGILIGGVRPKKEIAQIMPHQMLLDAGLPALEKSLEKAGVKSRNQIRVPKPKHDRAG